jgi:hypothetical protein
VDKPPACGTVEQGFGAVCRNHARGSGKARIIGTFRAVGNRYASAPWRASYTSASDPGERPCACFQPCPLQRSCCSRSASRLKLRLCRARQTARRPLPPNRLARSRGSPGQRTHSRLLEPQNVEGGNGSEQVFERELSNQFDIDRFLYRRIHALRNQRLARFRFRAQASRDVDRLWLVAVEACGQESADGTRSLPVQ